MTKNWEDRQYLVSLGVIDEQGVNATPRLRHCGRCGRACWAAWANGREEAVLVDPVALTPLGELQAITAGRATYTHWTGGVDIRRAQWIRRIPASPTNVIRPEHQCGTPFPDHYQSPPQMKATDNESDETIPF